MVEFHVHREEAQWEVGFEGDRRVVVARLGPFLRVYPRPHQFAPRFYHRVHELRIEDWEFPLEPPRLGELCGMTASLSIRFQPTLRYAREHVEQLEDLGGYIRTCYQTLLRDAAEQELRELEWVEWGEGAAPRMERRIENLVHELLALRDIQSRTRCRIEAVFADPDQLDERTAASQHKGVYLEILRRRREMDERLAREKYETELQTHRLRLEHEERLLDVLEREAELRRQREAKETERLREELSAEETLAVEQFDGEIRLREERIRHEARLRQMELDADIAEKNRRAVALDDVELHLRREIELLALERQRLGLEEEIHDVRVARAKGWVINARRRFAQEEAQRVQESREPNTQA